MRPARYAAREAAQRKALRGVVLWQAEALPFHLANIGKSEGARLKGKAAATKATATG